jgi:hypothetical protein
MQAQPRGGSLDAVNGSPATQTRCRLNPPECAAGDGQVLSGVPKLPSEVAIATKADYVIGLLSGTRAEPAARLSRYFLAASKYGLVPLAWSVTSTTRVISGAALVMATSIPCVRVTGAMAQP